ncbi:hypothetical protein BSL78_24654 [Apostichopus japonicus]|uniref:Uncharacterized protein n=1 Tax=Stichopus japonicus TaxID=307972 RepID=A0A2G8JRW8_STIJA|nr:hypothetical protein BSL78_24654 [Apostichopus japonicus]
MLNCNTARPSEANKAASSAAAAPVATPKSRKVTSSPFEGAQHLKRPTNLKFPTRQQQQHQQQLTPPASFPNISTSNQAAMLMELVRPSIAKAAVMSNPQSPVVSTQQYNLSLGILQNHMHLEQHAPLQFLQRPQVPQAPPNHPNHRMAHWDEPRANQPSSLLRDAVASEQTSHTSGQGRYEWCSGGGNPVQKVPKNANPWYWSVPEVMQFLHDAGEGVCADTFYRQQINGQKLMSLNKEQIAKLTGVKVASFSEDISTDFKTAEHVPPPPPLALPPSPSQGPSQ